MLLMFVSVVLLYMGISSVLILVLSLLGHWPGFGAVGQVARAVEGVVFLAVAVELMRVVRRLQRP